ncbi:MAG: N-acetylglucosamine-6-phosphate deacetylase, partial [Paracoccaceae bacterium]
DPSPATLTTMARAHRGLGSVAILPTVITSAPDVLDRAVAASLNAPQIPGIIGLHIEGPHIAHKRRGTHAAQYIRPLDDHTLNAVERLRARRVPVMLTLAPEAATPDQIARLSAMGCVVSLGHTDATAEQIQTALAAGACCGTHLFNAMSPMTGRAPGAVGALINAPVPCGIICDGHHVADDMVGLALRARARPDTLFLVSDAMATVGGPDQFDLYGQTITLRDGKLVNAEGSLAGAHVTVAQSVQRMVQRVGAPLDVALRMATAIPATCIGRPDLGTLVGRAVEDLLHLSPDLALLGPLMAQQPLGTDRAYHARSAQ